MTVGDSTTTPDITLSIRMTLCSDDTLKGYVFADFDHARQWLSQSFVDRSKTKIEEVEIGEMHSCSSCRSGWTQTVKPIRKLTVDEFLGSAINDVR